MTDLYMTNIPLDLASLRRIAATRGYENDEGLALHHLLSEAFGKSVLQPFRLMAAKGANLYAYTSVDLATLCETVRDVATPDTLCLLSIDEIKQKAMPTDWAAGKRLGFELKTRPVRRLKEPAGKFKKGSEIDAYLLEALRHSKDNATKVGSRNSVYADWLARRLSDVATVDQLRIRRIQQTSIQRGSFRQTGPEVVYMGNITIKNSSEFQKKLTSGVGRHCAYGYGMLLLRPLNSR